MNFHKVLYNTAAVCSFVMLSHIKFIMLSFWRRRLYTTKEVNVMNLGSRMAQMEELQFHHLSEVYLGFVFRFLDDESLKQILCLGDSHDNLNFVESAHEELEQRKRCGESLVAKAESFHLASLKPGLKWIHNGFLLDAISLSSKFVREVHDIVASQAQIDGVPLSGTLKPGEFRTESTQIASFSHISPPAGQVEMLVQELCVQMDEMFTQSDELFRNVNEIEINREEFMINTVGLVFWRLTWIRPFGDANGRIAHIIAMYTAMRCNPARVHKWKDVLNLRSNLRMRGANGEEGDPLLGHPYPVALSDSDARKGKCFVEWRRQEIRPELTQLLSDADAEWMNKEYTSLQDLLSQQAESQNCWYAIGLTLMMKIWMPLARDLDTVAPHSQCQSTTMFFRKICVTGPRVYNDRQLLREINILNHPDFEVIPKSSKCFA